MVGRHIISDGAEGSDVPRHGDALLLGAGDGVGEGGEIHARRQMQRRPS